MLLAVGVATPTLTFAQHNGGGGHGAAHGRGYPGGGIHHGYPGYGHPGHFVGHPGYGYGFHHYPHYYYSHGFYPHYGYVYGGLALGLFVASLPLYYDTIWWDGVPYYYSDGTYYTYNDHVRRYEVVPPPYSDEAARTAEVAANKDLFVYPKEGQSEEKQKTDRFECHEWAASQSGYDPSTSAAASPDKQSDYRRAETACLTGRGYSVK